MNPVMEKYFLYLGPKAPAEVSWATQPEYGQLKSGQGSLQEVAAIMRDREVVVIVPGPEVLHTEAAVPRHHRRLLLKSIPYILEESLAEEIELLQFATGPVDQEDVVPVAVVSRERMDAWLAMLEENAITATRMVPAALTVPLDSGRWSLVLNTNQFLLRQGTWQAWAGDIRDLPRYLATEENRLNTTKVQLFTAPGAIDPAELPATIEITATTEKSLIEVMAEGYNEETSLDLLQGDYSPRAQWRELWHNWRLPLVAAAIICLVTVSGSLVEYFNQKEVSEDLDRQIRAVYLNTFPDSRRIVNPRAQMKQKLAELQKTAGRQGVFFALHDKISRLLTDADGFSLNILRFKNNRFEFDFEVRDLQTLDKLKQQLAETPEVVVEIRNVESARNRVKARIQIKPGDKK